MKKYRVIALLAAAVMLSACTAGEPDASGGNSPTETASETEGAAATAAPETTAAAPQTKETEGEPPVSPDVVIDGLLDSDVVYEIYGGGYRDGLLTLGFCCAVPYGTPFEEREENYQRLYSSTSRSGSDTWNDLEVISASSTYDVGTWRWVVVQSLRLGGNITFSGKAEYMTYFDDDEIMGIAVRLDEESLKKLPSLNPYYFYDDADYEFVDENVFFIFYEDSEYYGELSEKLEGKDEIGVAIETDDFSLEYTYFGLVTDGRTCGRFHNIISITAE